MVNMLSRFLQGISSLFLQHLELYAMNKSVKSSVSLKVFVRTPSMIDIFLEFMKLFIDFPKSHPDFSLWFSQFQDGYNKEAGRYKTLHL